MGSVQNFDSIGANLNNGIFYTGGGGGGNVSSDYLAKADRETWMLRNPGQPYPGDPVQSGGTPTAANPFQGQMDSFLSGQQPAYSGPGTNRFEAGLASSEGRLKNLLDDPNSIQQSAAYKFRVGQGEEALNRNLAAKGMAGSGNRLTELNDYAQGQASQEYGNQFGRLKDLTGMYAGSWNQAQGTNVDEALGKYSTAMQGHSARGNTLASLYNTSGTNLSRESIDANNPWEFVRGAGSFNKRTGQIAAGGTGAWR